MSSSIDRSCKYLEQRKNTNNRKDTSGFAVKGILRSSIKLFLGNNNDRYDKIVLRRPISTAKTRTIILRYESMG